MDAAVQPELTCKTLHWRAGIHLKVGVKVKLKGCGAWLFQGYVHINASPKVFLFFNVCFFFYLCLIAPSTQAELKDEFAPPPKKEIKNDGKPVEGQNMSGASERYSASAFSLTTQVDGDLFSW